jgi:hypothetical protein
MRRSRSWRCPSCHGIRQFDHPVADPGCADATCDNAFGGTEPYTPPSPMLAPADVPAELREYDRLMREGPQH